VRQFSSSLVNFFISNTKLGSKKSESKSAAPNGSLPSGAGVPPVIQFDSDTPDVVRLLKSVAVTYIISSPALQAQQYGQRRIIGDLFLHLTAAMIQGGDATSWIPVRFRSIMEAFDKGVVSARRAAADCICSMTESEAIALRNRILGVDGGSVFHPVVR
jgi:dGTPase